MYKLACKNGLWVAFVISLSGIGVYVEAAASTNTLAHCNWGDFGCNNPPPKNASPNRVKQSNNQSQPVNKPAPLQPPVVSAGPNVVKACNKELSSPGECWTNCKTEEDITICDIIKLDTFMPEAPGSGVTDFKSADWVFNGQLLTKKYSGNKIGKGRVMIRKK